MEFEFFADGLPKFQLEVLQRQNETSVVNGYIQVKKFKLVVEEIEEPKEVLVERCKELYLKEKNWHYKNDIDKYVKRLIGKSMYNYLKSRRKVK